MLANKRKYRKRKRLLESIAASLHYKRNKRSPLVKLIKLLSLQVKQQNTVVPLRLALFTMRDS
jgi:hypothetical protein